MLPKRKAKQITSQALETLTIVALKHPLTAADIHVIRGIESAATVSTLYNRELIACSTFVGLRRERIWRTTRLFT